ncbi:zf-HC2 domain-containing protein [Dactylosporangium roseum]|uniref:Zf-HC2 domain-containing protein n=1 Tax=Dactylosporangium roseum TaxID=47989 RepID=A0ABY5Z142_9ACTN|nr:zf-HC2 domain-containing protein [Dactylosporangium roseum]UWZ35522.1 zf-HC2 domain-containing protein [Dactylosporangium roseum]
MECERYREALSARLDGEDEPIEPGLVDAHLAGCVACRRWERDAQAVTRLVRLQPVVATPLPVERLLAGFTAPRRQAAAARQQQQEQHEQQEQQRNRHRRLLVQVLRVLLGAFGAAQFVLGIAQAATSATTTHVHDAGHLFHESAAWNVAIGAGFAWIATRRATPAGALPMLTAFVALLALLSTNDLVTGRVETSRIVSHAFVLAGYVIVLALSRPGLDPGRPPAGRQGPPWRWRRPPVLDEEPAPSPARLRVIQGQAMMPSSDRKAA